MEAFLLGDDGYQAGGVRWFQGKAGAKPVCSDREVIALLLLMNVLPFQYRPRTMVTIGVPKAPGDLHRLRDLPNTVPCLVLPGFPTSFRPLGSFMNPWCQ